MGLHVKVIGDERPPQGGLAETLEMPPLIPKGLFYKCCPVSEIQNIGLLWAKVRMFCIESTDVCLKEVRCFYFPERLSVREVILSFSPLSKGMFYKLA